jgi:acetyl esterase/lipase
MGNEDGVRVYKNLTFATPNGGELKLDLYRPRNPEGLLPVVIWIFGGAFRIDNKKSCALPCPEIHPHLE